MDAVLQIIVTGLYLGAMYALASVGLALVYGTMGMFNMSHGLFMTVGAYAAYAACQNWGLPLPLGLLLGILAGGLAGTLLHVFVVRNILDADDFETIIMVATAGVAILLQDIILKQFGAYPFKQPIQLEGAFKIGNVAITYQSVLILVIAGILISAMAWLLAFTRFGRAIRATAMNREAAQLMGVRTERIYLQVMAISGVLAAAAGILISSLAGLSPALGDNPLIRAFIICVVAGLGSVTGAGFCAVAFGIVEAAIGYYLGVRFGLPLMLAVVILVLIIKPAGLFGQREIVRS
ncbi:branched-chain amino acid ABC transporter, permease (plasmid) [Aminobacter sp. Y103A]|uniref:branched-chain amino acid ABC transporter permease n=1 Tax=Aminobacter sp. Y103A TaxID=1870862 RepID=UPI002572ACAF|nr:branched-chain amino acid ABC transporter permease [Aminobacter sp. SS-2016]BBD41495.1 branched-chain amino acid ABC transporter, permease [Aminobacter sp. SS-2016]